jgi:hypothetical protein
VEWEKFSQTCLDLIVKITELYPAPMLPFLFNEFVAQCDAVCSKRVSDLGSCIDVSTSLRILGQLSDLFTTHFDENIDSVLPLLGKFAEILEFGLNNVSTVTDESRL